MFCGLEPELLPAAGSRDLSRPQHSPLHDRVPGINICEDGVNKTNYCKRKNWFDFYLKRKDSE